MALDPRLGLAQKYHREGLADDAWQLVQDLLSDADPLLEALHLAAVLRLDAGDASIALDLCKRVLKKNPESYEAHFHLGLAFEKLNQLPDAAAAYRQAVTLHHVYPLAWNNLGAILDQLGQPDEAMAAYQNAIDQDASFSLPYNNLGVALAGQGRFSAACKAFSLALSCDSQNIAALINLGVAEVERGEVAVGLTQFQRALAIEPRNQNAHDNLLFSSHFLNDDPRQLFESHRAWGQTMGASVRPHRPEAAAGRVLRVGYVSPDFRQHSVSFFFEPLLTAHDRSQVEVFCYATTAHADAVTARLKAKADHWRTITGLSTEDAVAMIKRDQIDVLVDLAGHTMGNRLDVFAARATPLQITGIGYPDTTGLPAMDARLCDAVTDPLETADAWATEKLVRLESGLHCYGPPGHAPGVGPLPSGQSGHVTFGSFNKLAKISPATIEMWAKVLRQVPAARLLVKAKALTEPETQNLLARRFAAHGITADRLDLLGWSPGDAAHLGLYNRVDIALDTSPYNGTTTTCEALWMGVPVITLAGRAHAGRVGASVLHTVGLDGLVCATPDQYVGCAGALAADLPRLKDLRAHLRVRMVRSPLCQAEAYAKAVEAAYRRLLSA